MASVGAAGGGVVRTCVRRKGRESFGWRQAAAGAYDRGRGDANRFRAPAAKTPRPAARAVLRCAARPRRSRRGRRRPAGRRPRARQSGGRPARPRRRGARGGRPAARQPRLRAVPRPARATRVDRPPLPRPLRRRASIPTREVAVVPGTKTALLELALALAESGDRILLPDPHYPDYPSGIALAGAEVGFVPLDPAAGWQPDLAAAPPAAALYLNFPSNPCAVCAGPGLFEAAVDYAGRTGTAIVHDAAYNDLVFDGRKPESFLATPGAKDVGVELWTMSKTFGMAGWRIGFVLGNAEIVERRQPARRPLSRRDPRPAPARRDRGARRPAGQRRGAPRRLRAPPRPARGGAARAARVRRDVLRLAPPSRRAHAGAAARRAPRRRRAGRGVRAERRRLGAHLARGHRRDARGRDRAARRPLSRRPTHEDRHRRPLLLVVLGRGRRARREPGERPPCPGSRCADLDGPRSARGEDPATPPADRASRRSPVRDHPDRALGGRSRKRLAPERRPLAAGDAARARRARRAAVRPPAPARADDPGDLRRLARVRELPGRRNVACRGRPRPGCAPG